MFRRTVFSLISNSFTGKSVYIFSLILVCLSPQFGYSQNPETRDDGIITLEPGKSVERELSGDERHGYRISLAANQFARVAVQQRGIDVAVRLETPSGETIETDFDPRKKGVERSEFTAESKGDFTITVWTKQKKAAKGLYRIRIEEIRAASEKDFALDEARRLNWEATRLWFADKYDEALPLAKRSLAIRERELGGEHADVGSSLMTLANQYNYKGDYRTAEPLYLRAISIKEKALGKDDLSLSVILINLCNLYQDLGNWVKAEAVCERALKIRENHLEPDHLLIANLLVNLGNISRARGDWAKGASHYRRVLEIREKTLGPDHPDVASILTNLGNLYADNEAYSSKSETLYLRALKIRENNLEPDDPQIGQSLFNLAILYAKAGDSTKALSFAQRTLTIFEKSLGAEHPFTGLIVHNLASIYTALGDHPRAEALYRRSVSIKRKSQGEYHPLLGTNYANLASLYALKGEIEKAISEQTRAVAIFEFNTVLNLTSGSERQKLEYMKTLREIEDRTLTLGFEFASASKEAAALSATIILQRKGRVLDAMSDNLNALRRRFNEQDRILLDNLNKVTEEIAELVSGDSENFSAEEKQAKIKSLTDEREKFEREISRRASGFYEPSKPNVLANVQSAIPSESALLEFAVYQPASMSSLTGYSGAAPRYAVFVLRSGEIGWRDLGAAKEINERVEAFRRALRDRNRKDVRQLGRAVDEKIMKPVRALLGDSKQLLISPDGELNLIPFEALVDEENRFLVENYSFSYLTSGRDLLRMRSPHESENNLLVIANPSFDLPDARRAAQVAPNSRNKKLRNITSARNLSETYFAPLSGTEREARAIQTLFPEALSLTGARATETALKQTTAPRILHIATHGFFLEDSDASENASTKITNPLLRSGLALAGANQRKGGEDDGILTALEASGLNLWGTKLVVLSACDAGLGEVRNGEGVYGLRRAFVLAGTESLVMSLWAVRDAVTRDLMTNYYKNLKQGMGRGAALRRVQLEFLKRRGQEHPFYWASFIQSGEWANLDGRR